MPLKAPVLDDRSFDEIRDELLSRIPRYTPEWTDFNRSDPGITLIELFSWLTEMTLYQMNRLPDRNYIKFLKLLNMELRPPLPATAYLTFTPKKGATPGPVARRTQVAAQSPDTGQLVIFETDQGFDLIPYVLNAVQVYDGAAFSVVTEANQKRGTAFRPLGWAPQLGSALYLGFVPPDTPPAPGVRLFPQQIRFRVFMPAAAQAGAPQHCEAQSQVARAPVRLVWEYRHPQPPRGWRPLTVFQDGSNAFTREGDIVLEGPAEIAATSEGKVTDASRFWLRCRLDRGAYPAGQVPEVDFIRPNTVSAASLTSVGNEILGISEGVPDQSLDFRFQPVDRDSLKIRVDRSETEREYWTRVDDFLASKPADPHYVLNATSGRIQFGDGQRGRIPVAGTEIIAEAYRHGGGGSANVAADSITLILSPVVGVDSANNERPAVGGKDEQDLEELKSQAPLALRHRNRAVTPDDFAALAEQAGGVVKAKALALAHPDFPEVAVPGAVTVVIVPDTDDQPPEPSGDLIRSVCGYLNGFRLLTTELYVKGPNYVAITVQARVAAEPYAAFGAVEAAVKAALDTFLDPVQWPFGLDLYPTSLFGALLGAEGVAEVLDLGLLVNGIPHDDLSQSLVLQPHELVYGANHQITVVEREDR